MKSKFAMNIFNIHHYSALNIISTQSLYLTNHSKMLKVSQNIYKTSFYLCKSFYKFWKLPLHN
jgi:hypothetical protein